MARRRSQAAVPHHRLQARQERTSRPRSSTIEYDPNRSARIALLTYADGEKRYILQPLGLKVGDTVDVRRRPSTSCRATALPLKNIPLGTHDPQRRAASPARAARWRAAPAPAVQLVAKRGRLRLGEDAVGRDPQDHRRVPARRSARSATSTTRTCRSARPAAAAGWASVRTCAAWP